MNTDFAEEYKNWIEKLSEENFNELVKNYTKEFYNTKDVYITNGPYDGGIDLVISKDGVEIKRNIQITVQKKGFEIKLFEDVKKSKDNVLKYGYLNKLDFYISSRITKSKKNELIRDAEVNFQIALQIIDANELGELANEYKSIRQTIHKFHKAAFPKDELSIDKNTKILFDTLTLSKDMAALKTNFIQSLILSYLYQKQKATVDEIYNGLKSSVYEGVQKNYFEIEIGKLKTANKLIDIQGTKPKQFELTENVLSKMQEIDQNAQIHESALIQEFESIINRFQISIQAKEIVGYIINLYNANYEIDEKEILNESNNHNKKIQQIFKDLITHLQKQHGVDEKVSNEIARNLLLVCDKNDFLNKTSISKMFLNLFKSDKLEEYLSTSKREVYLDTQILLQIICCEYSDIEYDDQLYRAIKIFMDAIKQSSVPIDLHTTIGYVEEVAWHILNGSKLERFLDLPYIKDLGPSKNVFFNFYLELKNNHTEFEDFGEFIEELFDIDISLYTKEDDFIKDLVQSLIERFELLGIEVGYPPLFDNYEKYKKEYEITLSYMKHDQKSYEARKHDLNTVLHLSNMYYDFDEQSFAEPFLVTWDTSFYEIRKSFKKFAELNHWYLYPPMKFANTISIINFKIDSKAINYNIISLVEENFNLSNDTISFFDLINGLFNDGDATKWKLANKLAKLRKQLLNNVELEDFHKGSGKNLPIDELLLLIQNHYQNPQNKKSYSDLSLLFQNNNYADDIVSMIESHLEDFQTRTGINNQIIDKIDKMIAENNKQQ